MSKIKERHLNWGFVLGCTFLLAITVANLDKVALPRELEQYTATALENPDVFAKDDLGACFLSSTNDIIPVLISRTNNFQKILIYYLVYVFTIFLLFKTAQLIVAEGAWAMIVPLVILYAPWNGLGFNTVMFKVEFMGMVLAGPFLAGCLLFFLKERYVWAGLSAALSFYLQPGSTIWLLSAMVSFLPIAMVFDHRLHREHRLNYREIAGKSWVFVAVFILVAWPRLKVLLHTGGTQSYIDPQFGYDLLRHIWRGQTSLWLSFKFDPLVSVLSWAGFLFLFIINVMSLWNNKDKNVRLIFYMFLGSSVFLIMNELLINLLNFRLGVLYGLCRSSGFNFLFAVLLMAFIIRDSFCKKNYVEFSVWTLFLMMFFVVHGLPGMIIHTALLAALVGLRYSNMAWDMERKVRSIVENNLVPLKRAVGLFCMLLMILVLGMTMVKVPKKIKNIIVRSQDPYRQAIEYVNAHNSSGDLVLYPFTKEDGYFRYSRSPGFFTSYYVVVFIPLYQFDAVIQQKAYEKFRTLEKEFGINTWDQVRKDPAHYRDAWEKAWSSRVDKDFVERWSKKFNIRYIIREKELSDLPYEKVFENKEFRVYIR